MLQLARILGRESVARQLGLSPGQMPSSLTAEQLAALRSLTGEHSEEIARALLEEAAACDDVTDAASALAYLDDRFAFLDDLLSQETRLRIRRRFAAVARGWG